MKKLSLLVGILTATLLLGACGNEESKEETKAKTEHSEKSKENHKKDEPSKKDNKENESQESKQPVEEIAQQETVQEPVQEPVQETSPNNNQPNGDAMYDVPVGQRELSEEDLAIEEAKPEYQDVVETEEEVAEAEKETLREKYDGGLSSGEIQTKNAIENGYYEGPNADEVLKEIESEEQKIKDGYYE